MESERKALRTIMAASMLSMPYINTYRDLEDLSGDVKYSGGYSGRRKSQLTKKQKAKRNKAKAARKARKR